MKLFLKSPLQITSCTPDCAQCTIIIMKVPKLEEQQGRYIYLSRSEYLSTTVLPWTTPSPYKKKVAHFVRTNDKSLILDWANNDHILGLRSRNGLNLDISIIQFTRSIIWVGMGEREDGVSVHHKDALSFLIVVHMHWEGFAKIIVKKNSLICQII